MSSFSAQGILDICPKELAGRLDITLFDELDSTNTYLKKLARAGAEEGRIIIARRQSAGRGRLGRSFYSDAEGLYISVLIRPHMKAESMVFVTAMTAVAMARAIERTVNADARIKWVNDIFVQALPIVILGYKHKIAVFRRPRPAEKNLRTHERGYFALQCFQPLFGFRGVFKRAPAARFGQKFEHYRVPDHESFSFNVVSIYSFASLTAAYQT